MNPKTTSFRIECRLPFDPELTRNPADDPNNPHGTWTHILTLAARSGLTVLSSICHPFVGGGVSGVAILAESSLALHTWPESDFALVEVTTCGDPAAAARFASAVGQSAAFGQADIIPFVRPDRNLNGAREFIDAITYGGKLWPNPWGQDVGMAAFVLTDSGSRPKWRAERPGDPKTDVQRPRRDPAEFAEAVRRSMDGMTEEQREDVFVSLGGPPSAKVNPGTNPDDSEPYCAQAVRFDRSKAGAVLDRLSEDWTDDPDASQSPSRACAPAPSRASDINDSSSPNVESFKVDD